MSLLTEYEGLTEGGMLLFAGSFLFCFVCKNGSL